MIKKILILTDTYYPDKTSGAKLLLDLQTSLKDRKISSLIISAKNGSFFKKNLVKKNIIQVYVGFIKSNNFYIRGFYEYLMQYIIWFKTKSYVYKKTENHSRI